MDTTPEHTAHRAFLLRQAEARAAAKAKLLSPPVVLHAADAALPPVAESSHDELHTAEIDGKTVGWVSAPAQLAPPAARSESADEPSAHALDTRAADDTNSDASTVGSSFASSTSSAAAAAEAAPPPAVGHAMDAAVAVGAAGPAPAVESAGHETPASSVSPRPAIHAAAPAPPPPAAVAKAAEKEQAVAEEEATQNGSSPTAAATTVAPPAPTPSAPAPPSGAAEAHAAPSLPPAVSNAHPFESRVAALEEVTSARAATPPVAALAVGDAAAAGSAASAHAAPAFTPEAAPKPAAKAGEAAPVEAAATHNGLSSAAALAAGGAAAAAGAAASAHVSHAAPPPAAPPPPPPAPPSPSPPAAAAAHAPPPPPKLVVLAPPTSPLGPRGGAPPLPPPSPRSVSAAPTPSSGVSTPAGFSAGAAAQPRAPHPPAAAPAPPPLQSLASFVQKGEEGKVIAGLSDVDLTKGLFFFGNRLCPFAHRAWWALHEKGAASKYTYIHIELGDDKPAWYKEVVNPQGTVPCVYDGGKAVFESALVVEYFEDKFHGKGQRLMPGDACARAAVRLFVSQFNPGPFYALLMSPEGPARDAAKAAFESALAGIEARYASFHPTGPFFLGHDLSAADVALLPFVDRFLPVLSHFRSVYLLAAAPRVAAAFAAVQQRHGWKATTQKASLYIAAYSNYANGVTAMPRSVTPAPPLAIADKE